MATYRTGLLGGAALLLASSAAQADALSTPSMSGPLVANPNPISYDADLLGKIYVTGAVSGFGVWQSNPYFGDRDFRWDVSNGQVFIQKTDGLVQFFIQVGAYNFPSLGTPIVSTSHETSDTFGALPQAFLKIAPTDTFNIEAGKLPTLIGAEYTFSFENVNVERGLLWNQENAVNRGVQANYTLGPVAFSLSWNDGFYSDRLNWLWGSAAWTIDPANSVTFVGGGNMGHTGYSSFVTPLLQNNGEIFNLIYTHTDGPWTFTPYVQYTHVPSSTQLGIPSSGNTWGGAVLVNYNIDPNWNLAARAEYIASSGSLNLLYGPHSKAWSLTVTPTYQYKVFFARPELSYVSATDTTPFDTAFGSLGTKKDQVRIMLEAGVLF